MLMRSFSVVTMSSSRSRTASRSCHISLLRVEPLEALEALDVHLVGREHLAIGLDGAVGVLQAHLVALGDLELGPLYLVRVLEAPRPCA